MAHNRQGNHSAKHVVLHVGLPKTGSSTFQNGILQNRALLEAEGLAFDEKQGVTKRFRQEMRLAVQRGSNAWRRARLARAAREIRSWVDQQEQDTVLISDENLIGIRIRDMYRRRYDAGPALAVATLRRALEGHRLSWVLVRRDAKAHMGSAYRYVVKLRGISDTYEDWAAHMGTPEALDRLVEDAAADFGAEGHILDMEAEKASPLPWGASILKVADVSDATIAKLQPFRQTNKGLPDDLLPYIRQINAIGLRREDRRKTVEVMLNLYADLSGDAPRAVYGNIPGAS